MIDETRAVLRAGWMGAALVFATVACSDTVEPNFAAVDQRGTRRGVIATAAIGIPANLPNRCGHQLTGVAFDGTHYYVAEGQFGLHNCIIRYTADGAFVDQRVIAIDMRGLHYVPATGQLTTRHYNGGIVGVDYASGTVTVLANYRTGPDQFAPAVDPAGGSYWIINGSTAEQHRLSDNVVLKSFGVTTDNPSVIAVSDRWFYTLVGTTVHVYSKMTGYEVGTRTLNSALGCQGWGFGASANGDRLLEVTACDNATGQLTGMGGPGLTSSCGRQLTGVAFDGNNYFVAEGQFSANNCISRFSADSQFLDQRLINLDMRGLHYVPALGRLATRHYNGGIVGVDYASGSVINLANYRTGPDQYAPAVDPAGGSYWIINGSTAEQHRLSDNVVLKSFGVTTDNPFVIGVSNRWVYTVQGSTVRVYSKGTGYEVATRTLGSSLGCQGWGLGSSEKGDQLLNVKDCGTASSLLTGLGGKGLTSSCGRQLTGVAFDGTNYYVAEGQFSANNCISRFSADSQFIDQRLINFDMRGLHYVPATGKLVTRHYNGGLADIDYASGAVTQTYGVVTQDQVAPAPDPAGSTYWIINSGNAEQRQLSNSTIVRSFPIETDDPFVIAVSDSWVFTHDATSIHAYDKLGNEVATIPLVLQLGCQGWGFGVSANADRLLYVSTCNEAAAQTITPPPPGNTPPGSNVLVVPNDPVSGNPTSVELIFGTVGTAGTTTASVGTIGGAGAPTAPAGFLIGDPPTYYDIETSATFGGAITICIGYTGVSFTDESQLRLLHGDGGGWTDVTTSLDTGSNRICGTATSLSPFLVAQRKQTQSIAFAPLPEATLGDPDLHLTATATSGLPIAFSLGAASIGCTLTGAVLHIAAVTGSGEHCVVIAGQAGDDTWLPAPSVTRAFSISPPQVSAIGPASLWVGLKNSDAVGLRVDLRAEVLVNGVVVATGDLQNIPTGSSGFNNAKLNSSALALANGSVDLPAGSTLDFKVSVRRTCSGGGHNSGSVRLWYNGQPTDAGAARDAGSRFPATVGDVSATRFLRTGFTLDASAGTAKQFVDVAVNSSAPCPGRPFVSFGTWNSVVQ